MWGNPIGAIHRIKNLWASFKALACKLLGFVEIRSISSANPSTMDALYATAKIVGQRRKATMGNVSNNEDKFAFRFAEDGFYYAAAKGAFDEYVDQRKKYEYLRWMSIPTDETSTRHGNTRPGVERRRMPESSIGGSSTTSSGHNHGSGSSHSARALGVGTKHDILQQSSARSRQRRQRD
ncbi:hypothetical protein SeLEV6574_g04328 [Synchytrium endobioticum]|uniref:SURP motif domain-containing protein n=1 Tax=Synchytrium endobioticum TaxID=286115 RepID=A0A507D0J7_9FUNG|nr:hypothetical protein SeLEV6574_g04328 [Synchytrium endobioticum]